MTTATKSVTREQLIDSMQAAANKKGKTPTTLDADRRKYDLYAKMRYINEFGTWNAAVEAAGLEVNKWKGGRRKRTGPLLGGFSNMEEFIEAKLQQDREEIEMLEKTLSMFRSSSRTRRTEG